MTNKSTTTPTLHERKRLAAMRAVQRHAIRLFIDRGFDAVTVQEIAEVAEVSPVSVYRWFGTKERIVLWDEYDPGMFAAVAERLGRQPPLEAVRDALVEELERIYDADRGLVLARTKLIHREPALLAASFDDVRALQGAFVELFGAAGVGSGRFERDVLAASCVGVLVTAIDHWQREDGVTPLASHILAGFDVLRRLTWTS